jgi:hypothetical protein
MADWCVLTRPSRTRWPQLSTPLWSGFVPPDLSVGEQAPFVNYAPPFQAAFNEYSKYGVALPNNTNFTLYGRALNTVTGDFAQDPGLSICCKGNAASWDTGEGKEARWLNQVRTLTRT